MNRKRFVLPLCLSCAIGLCGCGAVEFDLPYTIAQSNSSFDFDIIKNENRYGSFASTLAVVSGDTIASSLSLDGDTFDDSVIGSAIMVDVDGHEPLFSKSAFERMYPASMTKVMTAIVALEEGNLQQVLEAGEDVVVTESDVQSAKIQSGDQMTLDQALHILLIYSANDAATLIADGISGSVEAFADKMNEKARELGATNTHFVNPNGLHDEDHYTTAYDMYLIFNEAVKNDTIREIISTYKYSTVWKNAQGEDVSYECKNTNGYMNGRYLPPKNLNIVGGKTGTTLIAGSCLVLLSEDKSGKPYISCIMRGRGVDNLYKKMTEILESVG